ncbi:MAG TPA: hypothetical protein PLI12_05180, partial [Acetobacteraceae bacterium]|nr:hypothetical protein [Acetobacteraceae bacterium]
REDLDEDGLNEILDIALTNARDGELPATLGHVSLVAFAITIGTLCVMIDESTTAHRRYKDAFPGARIRLVFHAGYNHVEMFLPTETMEAMDESVRGFLRGR